MVIQAATEKQTITFDRSLDRLDVSVVDGWIRIVMSVRDEAVHVRLHIPGRVPLEGDLPISRLAIALERLLDEKP